MCERPDENQRNFLEIIYVPDSVVWDKAPPSEDVRTQILRTWICGREWELTACKAALDATIRGIVRRNDNPAWSGQVSKDLYQVPGHEIAACFGRSRPGLGFDPIQEFQFHETSASTTPEPHMVLRETGSGWSLIARNRLKSQI